jgi:oligoribonuclease NrnB/cAMP/cGMP phosphodiesterase (DHH superfamily)
MNGNNCLVLHHNDLDGKSAAAIVEKFEHMECTHVSMNYGYDIPWEKIKRAKRVYMVDFSLQPFKHMLKVKEMKGDNFIWIDHHITAIADLEASGQKFNGIQRVGEAGCELTWKWFSEQPYPKVIDYLGRYDVWDLVQGEDLFAVQTGMFLYDTDPTNTSLWSKLLNDDGELMEEILSKGSLCLEYQSRKNEVYCKSHSFDLSWGGYRFVVMNKMGVNSRAFDAKFNHDNYDAMMTFGYTNRNWSISMYTDKPGVDVGSLAATMGGGGHVGAAGFQCTELPFKLEMKKEKGL